VTERPSYGETLPHLDLEQIRATSEVGILTHPQVVVAQRTVQPSQRSRAPAVRAYDVPLQAKKWEDQPRYGVPTPVREEETGNHMP
jgi:hypothetical protein